MRLEGLQKHPAWFRHATIEKFLKFLKILKKSLKKKGRETEFKQKVNIASLDKFSSWTWTWTCPWNDCPWTYLQMNFSMLVKILTDRLVLFVLGYGLNLTVKIWPRLSDLLKGPVWKGLGDFEISSKCNTGGRFTFSFLIANLPTYFAFGTKNQKSISKIQTMIF